MHGLASTYMRVVCTKYFQNQYGREVPYFVDIVSYPTAVLYCGTPKLLTAFDEWHLLMESLFLEHSRCYLAHKCTNQSCNFHVVQGNKRST